MEWSHDFCLSCDRQISGTEHGAYCSQSCRLADLERASTAASSVSSQASWSSSSSRGYHVPPALNFSSHSSSSRYPPSASPSPRASPMSATAPSHHYSSQSAGYASERKPSQLYTSPSRTSLSSLQSYSQAESAALSAKVQSELRDYAGSFDHVRDWKRRVTVA